MILSKMQTRWEHILKQMESKSKSQKQFTVYIWQFHEHI